MRFLRSLWLRWRVRHDLYDDQPARHPALARVEVGEILPFKGTNWRLAMVREQPIPALVFVPVGETMASQVTHLQQLRRADRIFSKQEASARAAVDARAAR